MLLPDSNWLSDLNVMHAVHGIQFCLITLMIKLSLTFCIQFWIYQANAYAFTKVVLWRLQTLFSMHFWSMWCFFHALSPNIYHCPCPLLPSTRWKQHHRRSSPSSLTSPCCLCTAQRYIICFSSMVDCSLGWPMEAPPLRSTVSQTLMVVHLACG